MKGIIYILYLVLAPVLCFRNYIPLEDWGKKGTLQQLLKTTLTNIYVNILNIFNIKSSIVPVQK